MNETRVFADGYRGVFQKQEDFLDCLKSIGRNSFLERRNSRNLCLVAITSGSKMEEELKEKYADEGLDEDIITDTIINTGLLLKVRNQYYPVRSCAIKSILDRAGISGAGLRRVEKSVYARILNDCLKVAKGEALLCIQKFTYKGIPYKVEITDAAAFPQDYAAAMTVYQRIAEFSKVVTVDIGGFTLDYLLIRGGRPDLGVCDSLEKGVIKLYNDVASRINSEKDILLDDTDIDRIIRGERTDYDGEVLRIVEDMTRTFVDDILGTLRERGLDLKTSCMVFIGGGAMLLRKYLESSDNIGRSIFVEDICANAKGYGLLYQIQRKGR